MIGRSIKEGRGYCTKTMKSSTERKPTQQGVRGGGKGGLAVGRHGQVWLKVNLPACKDKQEEGMGEGEKCVPMSKARGRREGQPPNYAHITAGDDTTREDLPGKSHELTPGQRRKKNRKTKKLEQ